MKLAIMQPYFLPYIGYFQAIHAVDKYLLYGNVSYIKHGWINKNRILVKNGSLNDINIPLLDKSSNRLINEIRVNNSQQWEQKILKLIYYNYKGSRYFEEIFPLLEKLFGESYEYVAEWNAHAIIQLSNYLELETTIEYSCGENYIQLEERLVKIDHNDYSGFPFLTKPFPEKKVIRILSILNAEKANEYYNAIGGQNLYSKEDFNKYGVDLKFIKSDSIKYKQFSTKFVSDLSIIDVLMHNGKTGTQDLIKKYTLI